MSVETLREEVIETLRTADERKLLLVKRAIEEADEASDYVIPQEVMEEVERRRERYLRGEVKSYTPEEFMASLREAAKASKA